MGEMRVDTAIQAEKENYTGPAAGADPIEDDQEDFYSDLDAGAPLEDKSDDEATAESESSSEGTAKAEKADAESGTDPETDTEAQGAEGQEPGAEKASEASEDEEGTSESDADDGKRDNGLIPRSRYNKAAARVKELERQLQETQNKLQAKGLDKSSTDIVQEDPLSDLQEQVVEKNKELMAAIMDGETEKAIQLQTEIRGLDREIVREETRRTAEETVSRETALHEYTSTAAQLQAQYTEFDDTHPDFDQLLVNEALQLTKAFQATGEYTPAEALRKAVTFVAKDNQLQTIDEKQHSTDTPAVPAKERQTKPSPKQIKDKVSLAQGQPPKVTNTGAREENNPLLDDMTDEEFEALPVSTRRRMRGDFG